MVVGYESLITQFQFHLRGRTSSFIQRERPLSSSQGEYASPTFGQPSTAAVADVCSSPSYQEFRNSGMSALCPLCVLYVCPVCILRTDLFAIPEFLNTGATTYIRYSCRARLAERRGGVLYPVMMSEVARSLSTCRPSLRLRMSGSHTRSPYGGLMCGRRHALGSSEDPPPASQLGARSGRYHPVPRGVRRARALPTRCVASA